MKINGQRVQVEYQEVYKEDGAVISDPLKLPELKHLMPGFKVTFLQLLKAGRLADGREFQELRVVLAEIRERGAETRGDDGR